MKLRYLIPALAGCLATAPVQADEACGDVVIAEMNWASAAAMAQIDKIILEEGFGCDVELVIGDTVPTFTSMVEKGEPDFAPEIWVNSVREPLDAAVSEGKILIGGEVLKEGGVQGFWIPAALAEEHDLKTVADALARPELFPGAEDGTKGAFHTCPPGWDCGPISENLLRAYGALDGGFEIVETGSAAALDGTIARAVERGEGWIGYYWGPTALLGKYEMTLLDFGVPFDAQEWARCTSVPDCQDPKKNGWQTGEVYSLAAAPFAEKAGVAMDYVTKRSWDNATASAVLAWMDENQATSEDGAYFFLESFPDVWTAWVSPEVAEKVKSAL
ncbi:ABC transporter substrate-binding protein [Roseibium denhamense]|nr:ABC transporter substrate-binding protein [Roseibium denhamense]MTI07871.1 ABC transporter substrate-binding protein [Roseibium denhamense]